MKSHNCLNQHKTRNDFEVVIKHLERPLDAPQFGMKFMSISLRRAKQMRKIMYNRTLFISHKKTSTYVIEKGVFDSRSKENHFVV